MHRKVRFFVALFVIALHSLSLHSQIPFEPLDPPPPSSSTYNLSTKTPRTEDWTTLSLAKSGLPLSDIGAVPLSKIELPGGCTRELLRLQWRQGDPIDLYVIRPHGVAKPPVAVYILNYTTDIDIYRADGWCDQVNRDGVAVAGFASALSGQRFHSPHTMAQWFVSELQEALATSTHDVQMMLNYLDTRGDLDMKRVGILGQGSGGSIAILAAAADPRIGAMDLINPWGDWPDWLKGSKQIPERERANYLTPKFLQTVSGLDPIDSLPKWKGQALRIQQVLDDPVTPATARDKIAASAPMAEQVVRTPDKLAEARMWGTGGLSGWLAQQLTRPQP